MPPPEPGCNHPQAASYNPLFPNKWKEFNNRQLSRCHCSWSWDYYIFKDIFSPPLDSFGCYCCNLKLVSSVKRSRLLCNWSWAGYWWLVSGRWQPIKTIDWGSSRVQPMGDNKSITNNDFPNQVICHQSPGGFTGSLLAANTDQAVPSWGTVHFMSPPWHIHILYKAQKTHPQPKLSRVQRFWIQSSQYAFYPTLSFLIFDLTKRSRGPCRHVWRCVCSIGMQPPRLGGYLAQVGITRGQH